MANSDLGHKLTDKELAKLERRIATLYREAGERTKATIDAYFEQFKKRDEEMKALIGTVQNGKEWTEADYKQWRLNQIGRGGTLSGHAQQGCAEGDRCKRCGGVLYQRCDAGYLQPEPAIMRLTPLNVSPGISALTCGTSRR